MSTRDNDISGEPPGGLVRVRLARGEGAKTAASGFHSTPRTPVSRVTVLLTRVVMGNKRAFGNPFDDFSQLPRSIEPLLATEIAPVMNFDSFESVDSAGQPIIAARGVTCKNYRSR